MFSCDFSIKACAWLLSAETWSNEHARGLSEYNRRSKSSVLATVCVNATQQQTLLAQRDNFCWRTSAKKANPRLRDLAKKIWDPRPKETHEKRDFVTRYESFRDSEIGSRISETHDFQGTIRHPYSTFSCQWSSIFSFSKRTSYVWRELSNNSSTFAWILWS